MTRRILAVVLAVTALAVTAFFVPAAVAISNAQHRGQLLELQREAAIVASRVPPTGPLAADVLAVDVLAPVADPGHDLALYRPDGTLMAGQGPDRPDPIVLAGLAGNFAEGDVGGDLVAAVPVRFQPDGSAFVVRIDAPGAESRNRFLVSLAKLGLAGLAVVAVAGALGLRLARRLNRPIDALGRWAGSMDLIGDIRGRDARPPEPTGIVELDGLRDSLVGSRARIDELLRRERSFSSQVSHQLLTPVAALRVAIETERSAPRADPSVILDEALPQLDRLESTITSLLALARHLDRPASPFDLELVVRDRLVAVGPAAERAGRTIELVGGSLTVVSDADAVGHIVDVLVDNALRHGQGRITVTLSSGSTGSGSGDSGGQTDRVAFLEVADEGLTPSAGDPFADQRADTSHGIGLRLARSLAEASRGRLELVDQSTTVLRLTLPLDQL